MTYTPGPWHDDDQTATVDNAAGIPVASINVGDFGDEAVANANLIAGAPELLAEVAGLVDLIAADYPQQERVWLESARRALAKARGHQP